MQTTIEATRSETKERTLDDLAAMTGEALEALYRKGRTPTSLRAVDGAPRGRMLAVRGIEATPAKIPIAAFAASKAFVWDGKTFTAESDTRGRGINRVRLKGVLGEQDLFPFETRIDASSVDGKPAIVLDYDLRRNPPFIRRIHDEIREVAPGLFLGPAMWRRANDKVTLLWFALDTRR